MLSPNMILLSGRGTYNFVYCLKFSDGTQIAARVSNDDSEWFDPIVKESEIATMQYIRDSPLYNIPVPQIHAWDLTFSNPAGAPYILMDVVPGRRVSLDKLSHEDQLTILRKVAYIQAELSKPSEFSKIGCIYRGDDQQYKIGPLIGTAITGFETISIGGPFSSLEDLWLSRIEHYTLYAIQTWCRVEKDEIMIPPTMTPSTPQVFGQLLQLISGLVSRFIPPDELLTLCIHHTDLAVRNVLFDDNLEVTGVIDWERAQVVPLVLTGRFPNDIETDRHPFPCNTPPYEYWRHYYHDWTSLGDTSKYRKVFNRNGPVDMVAVVSRMIEMFYLKKFFASCVAAKDFRLTTLFIDAIAYIKFHEVIMYGPGSWLEHEHWVRETFWRIKLLGQGKKRTLLRIPEMYTGTAKPDELDLEELKLGNGDEKVDEGGEDDKKEK